jgi:amino acid transporter
MRKKIPGFSVFLLIVASIDSVRNLPSAALFGPSMIFFFLLAAITFLIPVSFVCAQHAASSTNEGGLYHWERKAFGEKWGIMAAWLHWINTIIWYPSFLTFLAATAAYLFEPSLADNKVYLVLMSLLFFWLITLLSLFGIHVSAMVNDVCVLFGTIFPMLLLIGMGVYWYFGNHPILIELTYDEVVPSLAKSSNWISLIAIMASFMGVELAGVHVKDTDRPKHHFHRALLSASAFILATMLFGALTVAAVVPKNEINLASGIMQTFTYFFTAFGLEIWLPEIKILVLLGSIGSLINWLVSPAKGLIEASEHGYIPHILAKKNSHGATPYMMILQAVIVSFFCLLLLLVPTVNAFYWFLLSLSTSMYMLVYILIRLCCTIPFKQHSCLASA